MEIIYGKSVVLEALKAKHKAYKLYVDTKNKDNQVDEIITLAKGQKVSVIPSDANYLKQLTNGLHQGVALEVEEYKYYDLDGVLKTINKEKPVFVMLDGLEDPHNLGAILRTCDASGVDGVIIPKNRSVKLSPTVAKVSTGAIEYVKVIEVTNLSQTIKKMKNLGYWICTAEKTENSIIYDKVDYDMPVVLVIGSEGKGVSRLVKEVSDFIVELPMCGHVNSLNASVSAAILIYEVMKTRRG